ncbi:hypothetical protein [Malacoplasma penetrans HF-2]|uniref:Uncharacterized protein n=1 Tax=Malacoplasma penetrans (strain HF-2) TaxID=272633 RepID=Q8EUE3_MALP2|nr:hypothetical protein [Malacoplasma penetrans]BAC44772.1 hypothetical protein [Malacoplasma penetrans HF-2]
MKSKNNDMLKLIVDLAKKVTNVEFDNLQLDEDKNTGSVFVRFELEQNMSEKITLALVYKELKEMRTDISELKTDVSHLKTDMVEVKADIAELKTDVAAIKACPTIQKELLLTK